MDEPSFEPPVEPPNGDEPPGNPGDDEPEWEDEEDDEPPGNPWDEEPDLWEDWVDEEDDGEPPVVVELVLSTIQ